MPSKVTKKSKVAVVSVPVEPVAEPVVAEPVVEPVAEPVAVEAAPAKKKGKKQPKIVAVVTPEGIEGSSLDCASSD